MLRSRVASGEEVAPEFPFLTGAAGSASVATARAVLPLKVERSRRPPAAVAARQRLHHRRDSLRGNALDSSGCRRARQGEKQFRSVVADPSRSGARSTTWRRERHADWQAAARSFFDFSVRFCEAVNAFR